MIQKETCDCYNCTAEVFIEDGEEIDGEFYCYDCLSEMDIGF